MIGSSCIWDLLRIIWETNSRSSNREKNTDESESESDPSACKILARVVATYARFASAINFFFLPLVFGQSTFQCPNSLHKAHCFLFISLKPDYTLIFPDYLFPSDWNSCFLPPMPLLLCSLKKTVCLTSLLH